MSKDDAVKSDIEHGGDSRKPTETRYEASNIRVRRNSPVKHDVQNVDYRKSIIAGLAENGPRKVSLNLPAYQPHPSSNFLPSSYANVRMQKGPPSVSATTQSSSGFAQAQSNDGPVKVHMPQSTGNTFPNQMDGMNSFDHLMASNISPSLPSNDGEIAVPSGEVHKGKQGDANADEMFSNDQFEELRYMLRWNFEQMQNMNKEDAAKLEREEEQTTLPKSVDVVIGDAETGNENVVDQIDKKFARRMSPCDQKQLFSPHTVPSTHTPSLPTSYSHTQTYSPLPFELSGKFRDWEDDILKELRNRFYSCCEECKKKVMDRVSPCSSRSLPDSSQPPLSATSPPTIILPSSRPADRDIARKLQELVDSLSLEQKRNLARIYSQLPKRITL